MEKKAYEAPVVTKVEINFSDRIVALSCGSENVDGEDVMPLHS